MLVGCPAMRTERLMILAPSAIRSTKARLNVFQALGRRSSRGATHGLKQRGQSAKIRRGQGELCRSERLRSPSAGNYRSRRGPTTSWPGKVIGGPLRGRDMVWERPQLWIHHHHNDWQNVGLAVGRHGD